MSAKSILRRAWLPVGLLLLLGAGGWIWHHHQDGNAPDPALSLAEAGRLSAPAVARIRPHLTPALTPPAGDGPAVRLRTGVLHPHADPQGGLRPVHTRPSARGYPWMVLFDGPIEASWRGALESADAVIRAYLPEHALLVEAPLAARTAINALPHVLWSGEYEPAHKIQPLLAALARQEPGLPVPVTIQTFAPEDAAGLLPSLAAQGASDVRATPGRRWGLVRAVLPARAAADLALLPEVQWVEHHELPQMLNDLAQATNHLNTASVRTEHGLDGTGQIVAVADTGLDTGDTNTLHPDFAGRLLQVFDLGRLTNWSDTYYHGTHTIGSLLGTGAASGGQYGGVTPGAQLVFQSVMDANESLSGLPADLNDLYQPPYDLGARIHSDSWGSAVNGEYNADAMASDEFTWDHPGLLAVYAAGNEGTDSDRNGVVDLSSLDAPASAKNVLAVGASESGRPPGTGGKTSRTYISAWVSDFPTAPISTDYISSSPTGEPQGLAGYSSRGPAADGRTKPDIVAPGTDIISVRSRASSDTGWGVLGSNTNYCFIGGTSMSTPLAAGAATLVRQYCTDELGLAAPSAALLKAALTGGARSLSPGQYGTNEFREIQPPPRPNPVEGFGQADVAGTLYPPDGLQAVLLEGPAALTTGASNSLLFLVTNSAPLTAALAYSDYPAALAAATMLVDDLDLLLLDPAGTPHLPNGRDSPDRLNNVEAIDIAAAGTGLWTLVVSAYNVPQGTQPYALYLRGAVRLPVSIAHTPLENTWNTNEDFLVVADLSSVGIVDPGAVVLHWNTTGDTNVFDEVAMTSTNGARYEGSIPAQPVGTQVYYYISAGPAELPAVHPAGAPATLHSFEINPPLALAVSGLPAELFSVDPAYGVHTLPSNTLIQARASYSYAGTNGWRTACIGWQGAGSVPAEGSADFCYFTLAGPSIITWLWQEQVALTHTSAPAGAISAATWHTAGGTATTLIAPESHRFNNVPLTFAGWEVDGLRWPTNNAPSRRQTGGIPMPAPRTATATYVATALDNDDNHLPDWFELRYFGGIGQDRFDDPDDDGYENEIEAADHTDPFDEDSTPQPPGILHEPLTSPATSPAPWALTATITDNYHVASATLHWQRNGGLARSVAMTNPAGSLFTAVLPSPARDGDTITYHLEALDDAGFAAQSATWTVTVAYARMASAPADISVSAPAATTTNATLQIQSSGSRPLEVRLEIAAIGFAEDVEGGTNGWTRPDGNTDWHISSYTSHSPSNAWYCGLEGSRVYRNSTHAALVTPPIQLAAEAPRLDFRHRARFEFDQDEYPDGHHYWDSGVLEITDNGGLTWNSLVPEGGYPGLVTSNSASPFPPDTPCFVDTADWDPVGADLAAFAGKIIQIRFRFGADAYVVAEGWRLDDIVVSPRTEYADWLALAATNLNLAGGETTNVDLACDTTTLPPMGAGHLAILIYHNDPEKDSPVVVPVALHNTTRRVFVAVSGDGEADPDGESFREPGAAFHVNLQASPGSFIADIRTNAAPAPLPDVISETNLDWPELGSNLDIRVVFAPVLADGLVPPEWLAQFGLTGRNWMAEASLDQDGDALLTWQEHELQSNPTNPADARLEVIFLPPEPPDTEWRITWQAFTNRDATYAILSTSNLLNGFAPFTNLPATPPVMTSPPLPPGPCFFGLQKQ